MNPFLYVLQQDKTAKRLSDWTNWFGCGLDGYWIEATRMVLLLWWWNFQTHHADSIFKKIVMVRWHRTIWSAFTARHTQHDQNTSHQPPLPLRFFLEVQPWSWCWSWYSEQSPWEQSLERQYRLCDRAEHNAQYGATLTATANLHSWDRATSSNHWLGQGAQLHNPPVLQSFGGIQSLWSSAYFCCTVFSQDMPARHQARDMPLRWDPSRSNSSMLRAVNSWPEDQHFLPFRMRELLGSAGIERNTRLGSL